MRRAVLLLRPGAARLRVPAMPLAVASARSRCLSTALHADTLLAYADGAARAASGDPASAKACLRASLQVDPAFVPAEIDLGLLMLQEGDDVGGFQVLQRAHGRYSAFCEQHGGGEVQLRHGDDALVPVNMALKGTAMHMGLAEVYQRRGDTLKQRVHLEMASRLSPRNKAVRLSLADMFLRGKQYDAAAAQIASVLEWEPTCRTSRQLLRTVYLGEAMLQTRDGNVHAAIATYERALSTLQQQGGPGEVSEDDQGARTQRAEVSFLLGGLHESIGDATTAMQWYRRAIAESSTHWRSRMALAAACHRLGVASSNTGLLDEAISLYAAALDIDGCKEKDRAHYGLGALYLLRQDVARAGDELRAAVEANGKLKEARVELANVLLAEGNVGGAVHHLQAALDIDPHYGAARSNLQQVLASQRSAAGTPPAADGGAAASLTHAAAQNEVDARREEDAFNAAFAAFDVETKDALRTVGEAELAGRRGEIQRALAGYANALPVIAKVAGAYPKLQEGLGAAYWNQGMMLQRSGESSQAREALELSFRTLSSLGRPLRTPRLAEHVFSSVVGVLVSTGDAHAAEAFCEEAARQPMLAASGTPPFMLGTLRILAGDLDRALAYFHRALEIEPFLAPALFNAGNVHLRKHSLSGDPAHLHKAVDFCERALAVDDKSFHALVFMGEAQLRLGHEAAGLAALHRALTLMPNFTTAHSVLGAHFAAKNRLAEAVHHLRVATATTEGVLPDVAERDHALLVVCLMRSGQLKEAVDVCDRLVALAPSVPRYQDLRAQLVSLSR